MRLFVISLVLAILALGVFGPATKACINDREVVKAEREFKSHYMDKTPAGEPVESSEPKSNPLMVFGAMGLGALLIGGTCVLAITKIVKS